MDKVTVVTLVFGEPSYLRGVFKDFEDAKRNAREWMEKNFPEYTSHDIKGDLKSFYMVSKTCIGNKEIEIKMEIREKFVQ